MMVRESSMQKKETATQALSLTLSEGRGNKPDCPTSMFRHFFVRFAIPFSELTNM
jgi:hypothetical protein